MKRPDPAATFQFDALDHLASARVMRMSLEEEAIYLRLMSLCWVEGSISADVETLSRLCKGASTGAIHRVLDCFEPHPETPHLLIHPLLETQRTKQREWREKCAAGGRKSAAKRSASISNTTLNHPSNGGATFQSPSSSPIPSPAPYTPAEHKRPPYPQGGMVR